MTLNSVQDDSKSSTIILTAFLDPKSKSKGLYKHVSLKTLPKFLIIS